MATPAVAQAAYRFYADDNSDVDSCTALAAQNTAINRDVGTTYRFIARVRIDLSSAANWSATSYWQYQYDGGTWTALTDTSSYVRVTAGLPTDGAVCDTSLLGATSFDPDGLYDDVNGTNASTSVTKSTQAEFAVCAYLVAADVAGGKVINLRLNSGTGTWSWTVTPSITVTRQISLSCDSGSVSISGTAATLTIGQVSFANARQHIIDGIDGSLSGGTTWDSVRSSIPVTDVVRTSDTVVTITLSALSSYNISEIEYLTATISPIVVVGKPGPFIAQPVVAIAISGVVHLDVDPGSFAITGTDATLKRALKLTADAGSFTISGTAATLYRKYTLSVDPGSFTISGTEATLENDQIITADPGSYTISGTEAALTHQHLLTADPGTFAITGVDAELTYVSSKSISAEAGTFDITGTEATFLRAYVFSADPGSYSVTGTDVVFKQKRTAFGGGIHLAGSAYTVSDATGSALGYIRSPNGFSTTIGTRYSFTIQIKQGTSDYNLIYLQDNTSACIARIYIAWSGGVPTVEARQGSGSFTAGQLETYYEVGGGWWFIRASGVAVNSATQGFVQIMPACGQLIGTGSPSISATGTVIVSPPSVDGKLLGTNAQQRGQVLTSWTQSNVTTTELGPAYLRRTTIFAADAGSFAISGTDATLKRALVFAADAGSFTISGTEVSFARGKSLAADPGTFDITGTEATLLHRSLISCGFPPLYLVTETSNGGQILNYSSTHPTTGTQVISFDIKGGTSTNCVVLYKNAPAPAMVIQLSIAWSGGVPNVTALNGTLIEVTPYGDGSYYVEASGTIPEEYSGIEHWLSVYPDNTVNTNRNIYIGAFTVSNGTMTDSLIDISAWSTKVNATVGATGISRDLVAVTGTSSTLARARTIAADSGSVSVTGTAITLKSKRVADPGSYAITGTAIAISQKRVADPGSIVITGTAALFSKTLILSVDSGSYSISGTAASLLRQIRFSADAGSVTITGISASIEQEYAITCESGSFAVTGTAVTFKSKRVADSGSYSISGTAALFKQKRVADPGVVSITGTAATLSKTVTLAADSGSYSITGTAALFKTKRVASAGSYAITGTAVAIKTKRVADPGSVLITGTAATVKPNKKITCDSGSFAITGTAITIKSVRVASAGSIVITGTDAELTKRVSRTLAADPGAITITGTAADLYKKLRISCDSGSYIITGTSASLIAKRFLSCDAGSYAISGTSADLRFKRIFSADAGSYSISGTAASLLKRSYLSADAGTVVITGTAAAISKTGAYVLGAEDGSYLISGTAASLLVSHLINIESGSFTWTGVAAALAYNRYIAANSGSFLLTGVDLDLASVGVVVRSGSTNLGVITDGLDGFTSLFKVVYRPDNGTLYRYEKFFLYNGHALAIQAGSTLTVNDSNYALYVETGVLTYDDRITPGAQSYTSSVALPQVNHGGSVGIWVRQQMTEDYVEAAVTLTLVMSGFSDYIFTLPRAMIAEDFNQQSAYRLTNFTDDTASVVTFDEGEAALSVVYTED